jgi:hypothetical protein
LLSRPKQIAKFVFLLGQQTFASEQIGADNTCAEEVVEEAFATLRDAPELDAQWSRLIGISIHIELEVRLD